MDRAVRRAGAPGGRAVESRAQPVKEQLDELSFEQQRRVLDFARKVKTETLPEGTPGEVLWELARSINFDPEDLKEIAEAIETECERIDWDGWQ